MSFLQHCKHITTFIFSIDGVLTDGTFIVFDSGQEARRLTSRDIYALSKAMKAGYRIIVLSAARIEAVESYLHKIGIAEVYTGIVDKKKRVEQYADEHGLDWGEILFMGDDEADIPLMQRVGFSCAPASASPSVRCIARYISTIEGGRGCVRDIVEKVLKVNDHWYLDPIAP
jgi:3-deoxy-D-manno-octulosonate 8-phosphate phosphatase (KDO 8-P phosphatase)